MPQTPKTAIGLDVGGTRIRAARITADGQMSGRIVEPVASDRAGFTAQVLRLIAQLGDATTGSVGIGIPGRVAGQSGAIQSAGYLDIAGLDLAAVITQETSLPCRVENDAAMALIAEGQHTTGLVAMITVGTGIGGALLQEGRPFYGADFAGQFGHIVVASDGPVCNCGRRGCVETLSAGPALGRLIAAAGLPASTTAAEVLTAADTGDAIAEQIASQWADPMRRALQSLIAVVDPTKVIFGGGLGCDMARAITRSPTNGVWFSRPVVAARLGDDAGVIGAGLAAHLVAST